MRRKPSRRTRPDQGLDGLLSFFERSGKLKSEPRLGWIIKLGLERPESVADHSYRTALMAMVYADARGLDAGKAVKIALLHDLPEAIVGDSIPGQRSPLQKTRSETAAMESLVSGLPDDIAKEYLGLWKEYEQGRSEEARLVKELDKLEMAVQASEYRKQDPQRYVAEFLRTARTAVKDSELRKLLDRLS